MAKRRRGNRLRPDDDDTTERRPLLRLAERSQPGPTLRKLPQKIRYSLAVIFAHLIDRVG